jgi:hypothetical protein
MSMRELPTSETTSLTNQIKLKTDINNYEHKTFKSTEEGSQEMLLNGLRQVYETNFCSEVQSGNYYLCHVIIAMLAQLYGSPEYKVTHIFRNYLKETMSIIIF